MNLDVVVTVTGLLGGAFSTWKIFSDLQLGRQSRMREDYKFAQGFFSDLALNPHMLPFLKQKGLQAIAGDTRLVAEEIEYLLTLHNSAEALRNFVLGRKYVEFLVTATGAQVVFLPEYKSKKKRTLQKWLYLAMYFVFYCGAVAPLIALMFERTSPQEALAEFALTALIFLPACFFAIKAGVKISKAEKLVENQHKHNQPLVMAIKRA